MGDIVIIASDEDLQTAGWRITPGGMDFLIAARSCVGSFSEEDAVAAAAAEAAAEAATQAAAPAAAMASAAAASVVASGGAAGSAPPPGQPQPDASMDGTLATQLTVVDEDEGPLAACLRDNSHIQVMVVELCAKRRRMQGEGHQGWR